MSVKNSHENEDEKEYAGLSHHDGFDSDHDDFWQSLMDLRSFSPTISENPMASSKVDSSAVSARESCQQHPAIGSRKRRKTLVEEDVTDELKQNNFVNAILEKSVDPEAVPFSWSRYLSDCLQVINLKNESSLHPFLLNTPMDSYFSTKLLPLQEFIVQRCIKMSNVVPDNRIRYQPPSHPVPSTTVQTNPMNRQIASILGSSPANMLPNPTFAAATNNTLTSHVVPNSRTYFSQNSQAFSSPKNDFEMSILLDQGPLLSKVSTSGGSSSSSNVISPGIFSSPIPAALSIHESSFDYLAEGTLRQSLIVESELVEPCSGLLFSPGSNF